MPATRYLRRGVTRFYFVPTIAASTKIPTAAEVAAGTRLDEQLHEVNGFAFANESIDAPNFKDRFTPQAPGEDVAEDSSMGLYQLKGGTDTIRAALPKDTAGYIVIFSEGVAGATPAIADKADTWPVIVASSTKQYTADNELARYMVNFSVTDTPAFDGALIA